MTLPTEDPTLEDTSRNLVTWMEPGALRLGPAGLVTVVAGAFALGIVVAVALLSAARDMPPLRRPTMH